MLLVRIKNGRHSEVTAKSQLGKTWRNRKGCTQKPAGVLSTVGSSKPSDIKNSENAKTIALIFVI